MRKIFIKIIFFVILFTVNAESKSSVIECFISPENFRSGQFVRLNAQTIPSQILHSKNLIARIATNNTFYSEKEMYQESKNLYFTDILIPEFCESIQIIFRYDEDNYIKKNNKIQQWAFNPKIPPTYLEDRQSEANPSCVMMQGFYWDCPTNWYTEMQKYASKLRYMHKGYGIDRIWYPPPQKSDFGINSMGYDPYDYYDLGQFKQKNTIPTRFGSQFELRETIQTYKSLNIKCMADIVLNHRVGGELELNDNFNSTQRPTNFKKVRSGKCVWDYRFFYPTKKESNDLGKFNDYPDIAHTILNKNQSAGDDLIEWGQWLKNNSNAGFNGGWRFDYVKGINPSFISKFRRITNTPFCILECWSDIEYIEKYSKFTGGTAAFDFPTFYTLAETFNNKSSIKNLIDPSKSLATKNPKIAVTFVANHDTDKDYFVPSITNNIMLAYAFILTYQGYPCIFWHDYFDKKLSNIGGQIGNGIDPLVWIRGHFGGKSISTKIIKADHSILAYEAIPSIQTKPGYLVIINNSNNKQLLSLTLTNERYFKQQLNCHAWFSYIKEHNKKHMNIMPDANGYVSCTVPPNGYLVFAPKE